MARVWGYYMAFWLCSFAQVCRELLHVYKSLKIEEENKTKQNFETFSSHRSPSDWGNLSVIAARAQSWASLGSLGECSPRGTYLALDVLGHLTDLFIHTVLSGFCLLLSPVHP